MATSDALREIFTAARPLVEQWLDVAEQIGALREVATNKGLDWSQVKALLKAQIQDERDEAGDGKRVRRIVEKAEFASAYADMLGLANMNEKKYFADDSAEVEVGIPATLPAHDAETGEIQEVPAQDSGGTALGESHGDKSNAARPASVDAQPNGRGSVGDAGESVVTAGETAPLSDGLAGPACAQDAEAANTKLAPISDADIPAFAKADYPQPNPRCQKLKPDCKYSHHPSHIACATCESAHQIAQRNKARAAA